MEEVEFQEWLTSLEQVKHNYSAVYDPSTMKIIRVGPSHALENEDNCYEIDSEIAERILSGEISIHSCYIDSANGDIAVTETKSLIKIDDVLHRIPSTTWSDIENPDVYLILDCKNSKITVQLGSQWGGTYNPLDEKIKTRKIVWSGDTQLEFLITDYNDPNVIYDAFNFAIQDLIENDLEYKIKVPSPEVSVYTKRIFKNYIMDYR